MPIADALQHTPEQSASESTFIVSRARYVCVYIYIIHTYTYYTHTHLSRTHRADFHCTPIKVLGLIRVSAVRKPHIVRLVVLFSLV